MDNLPDPELSHVANPFATVNDTAHGPAMTADRTPGEGDTCRICRSEGTDTEPLFHPCKCSGSIKFVHQECLMEWLSHSNKKHCELCKTPFRFTKLYDSHMPHTLPLHIFFRKAALHILGHILTWTRAVAVAVVWLIVLPWCIRWSWRGLFWLLDAGWARDAWLARDENQVLHSLPGHSLADSLADTFEQSVATVTTTAVAAATATATVTVTETAYVDPSSQPIGLNLSKMLISALLNPWRPFSNHKAMGHTDTAPTLANAASSTLLSDVKSLNSLTSSASLNRFILDVLEGQIVTFLIVIAFILVFLIREWVVQQQPIINAAAQLRDAELQVDIVDQAAQRLRAREALNDRAEERLDGANAMDLGDVAFQINRQLLELDPDTPDDSHDGQPDLDPGIMNDTNENELNIDPEGTNSRNTSGLHSDTTAVADEDESTNTTNSTETGGSTRQLDHRVVGESTNQDRVVAGDSKEDGDHSTESLEASDDAIAPTDQSSQFGEEIPHSVEIDAGSTGSGDSWQAVDLTVGEASRVEPTPSADQSVDHQNWNDDEGDRQRHEDSITSVPEHYATSPVTPGTETSRTGEHSAEVQINPEEDVFATSPVAAPQETETFGEESVQHEDIHTGQSPVIEPMRHDQEQAQERETDQAQPLEESSQQNQAPILEVPPANPIQRVFNWFWADITPNAEGGQLDPFEEVIVQDEVVQDAPLERPPGAEVGLVDVQLNEPLVRDAEVLQAAADAGLEADALDDVEDLEGILELIGMQGPLIGLLQTATFCGVLITATLWAALGAPYLFGKFALLFLGDPFVFLVVAPLRGISLVADAVVDTTIYVGGLVVYLLARASSQLLTWAMSVFYKDASSRSYDFLAKSAHDALHAAGGRLSNLITGESTFDTGFLTLSLHAHRSLQTLQIEAAQVTALSVRLASTIIQQLRNATMSQIIRTISTSLASEVSRTTERYSAVRAYLSSSFATSVNNGTFTLTVTRDSPHLDPSLAYWSSADRCFTILAGYVFLAMIGTAYLLRKEPLFSSAGLQKAERGFTDFLKQAGGVLKVILIISIEMLVFPLYCGLLLDCALLPLFSNASVGSRLLFAARSPWMFAFVHWFIGTCYMFHFALFVSACRKVMRNGVLYFIRDPDDPTFHPVRDVLERNVTTQLRKIAFSALVYGGLVICCLGGVVWGVDMAFPSVFPVRWATPEPLLEFPIDFLIYNLLAPIVTRFLLPSQGMESLFKLWLKRCARSLRLSHFLFGERQRDEEGYHTWNWHTSSSSGNDSKKPGFVRDGKYVRAPASDQVRIPKGERVFLEVTEDNKRVDGQTDSRTGPHGRKNKNFAKVYVPPWFRVRIGLFIFSLWFYAAATGLGMTVVPVVFGRMLLSVAPLQQIDFNDLYAFSAGLVTLGGIIYLLMKSRTGYISARANISGDIFKATVQGTNSHTLRMLKSIYVYGFALVVVPTLFALVLQLYLILPLHTYSSSWSTGSRNSTSGLMDATNATAPAYPVSQSPLDSPIVAGHTIHVLQDWTLGFLYGRIVLRLLSLSRNSRPATALRMITRDGYTNPDAKLATRAFIIPTLLLFSVVLLCPPVFALAANNMLRAFTSPVETHPQTIGVKVYRYSYPVCASQILVLWCSWEIVKATRRWRNRIKDEVYLIGERLHNFGERRPPEGSRSAIRRER